MEKMRQWSVLTGVATLAILVAGWFLLVAPQRSHASDLRTQAASQQAANASLQTKINQLEQQKKGLPAQQRTLEKIATKVPDNPELPALIRQLTVAAKASGVELVSLAPSQPTPVTTSTAPTAAAAPVATAGGRGAATLAQIPLGLVVEGSYYNVESFFNAVEKLSRAMRVVQWKLEPKGVATGPTSSGDAASAPGHGTAPGTLTGTLSALVFEAVPVPAVSAPVTATTAPATTAPSAAPAQ